MKPVKQKIFSDKTGDCFRACMASILEIPNSDNLPHIASKNWFGNWRKFLWKYGLSLEGDREKIWREGYWIASVPSLNFKGITHAIVMKGSKVAFDPSTHKKYRKGTSLLGSKNVGYGWWIEVSDFSKLRKFFSRKIK